MIIKNSLIPHSSFMSVDKDLELIVSWMQKDKNLCKLLYYSTKDALDKPALTKAQLNELLGRHIKIVPKLYVDGSVLSYVIVSMDNFIPSSNPEFRDNSITFDIICHFDQWQLQDFQLRPYRIAAEIDSLFNNQHLSGIGELHFTSASQMILTDEFAGLSLNYSATHGGEDKYNTPNPMDEESMEQNYLDMFK